MDRIQSLQIYVLVVETGSFTKCAEQLNLHVSVVSKAIKYLEHQLGTRLLNRTTRKISLTAEGEAFYEKSQSLLAELADTFHDLSSASRQAEGKLRIELPSAIAPFVIAHLLQFYQKYPQIQLILSVSDHLSNLIDEGLDCSLRLGELSDSSYIARPLAPIAMTTCATSHYLQQNGLPTELDELQQHRAVHYFSGKQRKIMSWHFLQQGENIRLKLPNKTLVNDSNALLHCALAGLGIVQMPTLLVAPYLATGQLQTVLPHLAPPAKTAWIVYPQRKHLPKRLEHFIEWVWGYF
ncbi:LysR family transcriptional regulator [Moraxella cuniculi]|uniref:D-malate degradation protein R n=1 Tax=Moraxella cuniculi TaxID=34061 RepID=A0A3S5EFW9_9GAMM|nr:LysR family transcriptional regulator [Moraxella cuniculi]VEG13027.1 D-malate degradation protein R [Moraxella cuniculi]